MPRPARFTEDQMLDAALELVASGGPGAATIGAIGRAVEAPVGSIYHRFKSHDLLLARLWIRTVRRFQGAFLEALGSEEDDEEAPVRAAVSTVQWVRKNPREGRALLLHRRQDLMAKWPEELGDELAGLNEQVEAALRSVARARYGRASDETLQRVSFALVEIPYAALRRHLATSTPPPASVDELVALTCRCVLGISEDSKPPQT